MPEISSNGLECDTEWQSQREKIGSASLKYAALGEKCIQSLQVCINCGGTFHLKRGRKSCPHCLGLLVVKITVAKKA